MTKFKKAYYIVLTILVLIFFTKDINLNEKFYKNIKTITKPNDILVLVNKNNKLKNDYVPLNLEDLPLKYANKNKKLVKEANEAFKLLHDDASKLGYRIVIVSSYRDYWYQKELFDYYVKEKGEAYALQCSAKPGHSEHQTGLAIDVEGKNKDYDNFEVTTEFKWMKDNSYKYGFILRYPKDKEKITGFKYEPWHYRYVGKKVAAYIYKHDITLEEYLK
ncbi:MAG: M15 family metallopeptidase [Bacilli bacterium]